MNLKSDVSYLRGLIEGGGIENEEKRAAIWAQLMNVFDGLVDGIEALSAYQNELSEYVEALDEDLSALENQVAPSGLDEEEDENQKVKEREF